MRKIVFSFLILLTFIGVQAQSSSEKNSLSVFIDCSNYSGDCYSSYLRQEIGLVTFVRDRLDADVDIIAIQNRNDFGSRKNTLFVIGQNHFLGMNDTINYTIPPNATEQEGRDLWTQYIKVALFPYLAKTSMACYVKLDYHRNDTAEKKQESEKDPFNLWVFQISTSGSFYGTQYKKELGANGNASAIRETDISKWNINASASEQYTKYINDGQTYKYEYQDFSSGVGYVKKLTEHIGLGANADLRNSIYSNLKFQYTYGPLFEYSFFPYKEFNSRRLIFQYSLDSRHNQYYDTTIYLKMKEQLFAQEASGIASFTQKWGSLDMCVFWRNLFNDFKKNHLSFYGALTTRLVHGLNFAVWGNYTFVHNQLNIRKGDLSLDQLLA